MRPIPVVVQPPVPFVVLPIHGTHPTWSTPIDNQHVLTTMCQVTTSPVYTVLQKAASDLKRVKSKKAKMNKRSKRVD